MCQISSLMAAAEGYVAEFSSFANFEEKKRKSNLLMPFPKTGSQMGSFGQIRKNSFFRFCRPILDIFGFTLLTYRVFMIVTKMAFISIQTLWETISNSLQTLCKADANALQTLCKLFSNALQTPFNRFRNPSKMLSNVMQTPSKLFQTLSKPF